MRVIACAYRSWAVKVVDAVEALFPEHSFNRARDPEALAALLVDGAPDAVLAIGWSWLFDKPILDASWVVGVHPSDLPAFAGGSPLQHQILAGITRTKNSLFRITPELDAGPVLGKVPLRLDGHMDEIFDRLTHTSIVLLVDFLRAFPNIKQVPQAGDTHKPLRRLTPASGQLSRELLVTLGTRQLYDFIRCREEPYPNAYIEDEAGRLVFRRADFISKDDA